MIFSKGYYFLSIALLFCINVQYNYASSCDTPICNGLTIPSGVQKIISNGYDDIAIENYLGNQYLVATTAHETNKCSVMFQINGGSISNIPTIGLSEPICNITIHNDKIVSSWRDAAKWNDDIYQVNSDGKWSLLFRDSCVGCNQIKRIYYSDNKKTGTSLLTDGEDFTTRKVLAGQVTTEKAALFKSADIKSETKSYLIKGDGVTLSDMSQDGTFYKIKYKSKSGKHISLWIRAEDFSLQ